MLRDEFLNILERRLEEPRVESARLRGIKDCYKIKLRSSGYRLVYKVMDEIVEVRVLSAGRRDGHVYDDATDRQNLAPVPAKGKNKTIRDEDH
jgi:mRNA interferase RelE/StbE